MISTRAFRIAFALASFAAAASAQFSGSSPMPAKSPSALTVPAPIPGGFASGSDDCALAHMNAGVGPVSGVPFTTGTTGSTGQTEVVCLDFGTEGIDGDVWFDWTSDWFGNARLQTCSTTGVDTKVAIWPDHSPSGCPADGTSITCGDDSCGAQTQCNWHVDPGTTYTLQIGTFPGAAGGSGTFEIAHAPYLLCGRYDDGFAETSIGLTAGGETGWLHAFDACQPDLGQILVGFGQPGVPSSIANGSAARFAVYWDTDGDQDPRAGLVPLWMGSGVVTNGGTNILNTYFVNPTLLLPSDIRIFVLASVSHAAGELPAALDTNSPTPRAWVVGSTAGPGSLDLLDLTNNDVAPLPIQSYGYAGAWRLQYGFGEHCMTCAGPPICFGDGFGAPCGCGNESRPFQPEGCLNGLDVGGRLESTGLAWVSMDTLQLRASYVRAQPGLFFQGDNEIAGGSGTTFGDGIRCCGSNVIRLQVVHPTGAEPAHASSTVTISQLPGQTISPGDTRCYQYWYRDPLGSPCGAHFNLTSAMRITWMP